MRSLARSPATLAFIRRHFSLHGETVLRDGTPIRARKGKDKAKYRRVHIRYSNGRKITWKLARLKFYLATGKLPEVVDHKSGVTRDDSLSNLRAATHAQNNQNKRAKKNKRGGFPRGIDERSPGRYRARIGHLHKPLYIGTFPSVEEAVAARNDAEKPLKGVFHRPRRKRPTEVAPFV